MTKYEQLLSEYEQRLHIVEKNMTCQGLYCDDTVWINKNLTMPEKYCILSEEIGHYETSVGDILDLSRPANAKQESIARKWAFRKILSKDKILEAVRRGNTELYDIAEYLDVSEEFLKEAMKYYGFG